ncbi:hypothetical protein Poli38472_004876 [Pythium oligandrum]|uniref:Amidase domain-containing protein n=1 Tax=Pythium oligandrum TaxID=41045 RepID=A0A8K1FHJ3_PYTOL|nr:hypothetical protein Poli38472_004876 [Pythium oligandrum]|eukprot:TMW59807.1 hypothetical protein Poli38472_004876 [Pythium oligandrum]
MRGLVALIVAVAIALLLLGEDQRLPDYDVVKQQQTSGGYDLVELDAPRLVGWSLQFLAFAIRMPVLGRIIAKLTYNGNNMLEVRRVAALNPDTPVYYPIVDPPKEQKKPKPLDLIAFSQQNGNAKSKSTTGFKHWSISDYTSRYASNEFSPVQVAKAVIAAVRELEQGEVPSRIFIETFEDELMAEARASAQRYAEGKPLGVLDGVPVAVKDEIAIYGHETCLPTFLRIPPLAARCPSLSNVGPIASNVRDAAIGYAVMSGGHEDLPHSLPQPAVELHAFESTSSPTGLRIGFFNSYTNHSSPEVAAAVREALRKLESLGAELVETKLEHLLAINLAYAVSISSELAQSYDKYYSHFAETATEVQAIIGFARHYSAMDFIAAQRVRGFAMRQLRDKVYSQVDAFVTPTTGRTAPVIPQDALKSGDLDSKQVSDLLRFAVLANLAGTPAVAVPIGFDTEGLPISLEIQSSHWEEDVMLRVAHATEELYTDSHRQPQTYVSIINESAKHAL